MWFLNKHYRKSSKVNIVYCYPIDRYTAHVKLRFIQKARMLSGVKLELANRAIIEAVTLSAFD